MQTMSIALRACARAQCSTPGCDGTFVFRRRARQQKFCIKCPPLGALPLLGAQIA